MKFAKTLKLLAAVAVLQLAPGLHAQETRPWPTKPIHLIVPFAPGGGVDINARLLGAQLTESLGAPVIIENKPGAGTNIGNEYVARAEPDGYTLLVTTAALAINMSLYKNLRFDALKDFAPVSLISVSPNILVVHPSSVPARSVRELVDLAKKKRGDLTYGSAGSGSTQHLVGELFKASTGTDILHVPYKGSSALLTSLVAGDINLTFANIAPIAPYVKSGRLRALATTGSRRSALMPDLPTMKEAGVDGVEVDVWVGLLAPARTPPQIVNRLAQAVAKAAAAPAFRKSLAEQGNDVETNTPAEFGKLMQGEVARWRKVIQTSGITPE
jgi:tripartite-type tricarboxylate transporter receptor subunit TctC